MGMVVMKAGLVTPEKKKNLAWLGRDVAAMQSAVEQCNLNHVPETIRKVLESGAWREFWMHTLYRFGSFAEFITTSKRDGGCGWRPDYVMALLEKSGDRETLKMFKQALREQQAQKVNAEDRANQRPVGRPKEIIDNKKDDVKDLAPTGNSESYAHRKLRKDRPDIHARVLAGELSPHAGMIEAGFRKKRERKKLTPLDHLNKWWDRATPDQQAAFLADKSTKNERAA